MKLLPTMSLKEDKLKHSERRKYLCWSYDHQISFYTQENVESCLAAVILKTVEHLTKTSAGQEWSRALRQWFSYLISIRITWIAYYRCGFLGSIAEVPQNLGEVSSAVCSQTTLGGILH